jgi:tRNA nucleotidyltransferase (CCA-adding enzyme)
MDFKINMPEEVEVALNILNEAGYDSYIVGGCVRDIILDGVPKDWDITTSALPTQIINCFKNFRTIETGLKHGTVTVIINNIQLEITTFRIDGEYKDNRRPDEVIFTNNISMDLKRRDFTINAMAYNYEDGLIDLYDGVVDINRKQIKCVGNADKRFNEDGLRLLRALRFASVLNFEIEETTSKSIHRNKDLLKNISTERIRVEFDKLILGVNFYNILKDYKDVIEIFVPEINKLNVNQYQHILKSMNYIKEDLVLKLALFFHEIGNTEVKVENIKLRTQLVKSILKRLKYDHITVKEVSTIILYFDTELSTDKKAIKKCLNVIGENMFKQIIKAKIAHRYQQESTGIVENVDNFVENFEKITFFVDKIIKQNECYNLKTLAVNGEDLKNIGVKQGKLVGEILNKLLDLVIDETLENDKDKLIEYVINNMQV